MKNMLNTSQPFINLKEKPNAWLDNLPATYASLGWSPMKDMNRRSDESDMWMVWQVNSLEHFLRQDILGVCQHEILEDRDQEPLSCHKVFQKGQDKILFLPKGPWPHHQRMHLTEGCHRGFDKERPLVWFIQRAEKEVWKTINEKVHI